MMKTDLDTFLKFIDQTGEQKHFRTVEIEGLDWTRGRKMRKEMSEMNDIFQVDYLPDEKKIKINLPEEVWKNIDTVIMTRLFQEELVVEKQKEGIERGSMMKKRDLLADLEAIREGATLFGDPNPGVNTQYELYEVAEHAIERALKAEALAQKLLDVLGKVISSYLVGRLEVDLDSVLEVNGLLKKSQGGVD